MTRQSRTNFSWAFFGLPKEKRFALHTLYAFCRTVDDIVDEAADFAEASEKLYRWRNYIARMDQPSAFDPALVHHLSKICQEFPIQRSDLLWIIDGVETDLTKKRYRTFEELLSYCDGVACAVGLASLAIFGSDRDRTAPYAFATGRALQLTNILRDVATDARRDRIYLPQEDLERFQVTEKEILRSAYSDRFVELMKFEAQRVKTFYSAAEQALPLPERKKYPAAELMRKTYETLLRRIETRKYNVFPKKITLSSPRKVAIALSVWAPHFLRAS